MQKEKKSDEQNNNTANMQPATEQAVEPRAENKKTEQKENAPSAEAADKGVNTAEAYRELEKERDELKDLLLRKQADFENFRKRLQREKEESIRYANAMLLLDLTHIIDDFERAIQSAKNSDDFASFHSGVELIEKRLTQMLEKKWGLKRFDSQGDEFDPDKHEAIMAEESENVDAPTVVEDFQRGYLLNERILRPAKVKVAQPQVAGNDTNGNNEGN
jgi:molecular chaperone GrpE